MAKSSEARRILRDLNKQLAAASERSGRKLSWTAQETAVIA
ncbi:hypothetical protein [Mycobacterium sp.]